MKYFEKLRFSVEAKCQFCNAQNMEIFDVRVGDYLLYDFERIVNRKTNFDEEMLILGISKNNYIYNTEFGGKELLSTQFINDVLIASIELIEDLDSEKCVQHDKGFFCVAFTGVWNGNICLLRLERFLYHGLTTEEIWSNFTKLIDRLKGLK